MGILGMIERYAFEGEHLTKIHEIDEMHELFIDIDLTTKSPTKNYELACLGSSSRLTFKISFVYLHLP